MEDLVFRIARRLSPRGYAFAKWYQRLRLRRIHQRSSGTVLVYQMGKVGSATIASSLKAVAPRYAVHHVHVLNREKLARFDRNTRAAFRRPLVSPEKRQILTERVVTETHLRRQLDRHPSGLGWKVVTLVRDPVARNLSSFFEILDIQMNYDLPGNLSRRGQEEVVAELCEKFLNEYPGHDQPLVFFENEIKQTLGLDVFATPFPRERGYAIYKSPNADVLLLRLEDLKKVASCAFEEFMGIRNFQIVQRNVGSEKDYAETYRHVLEAIRLPDSYLDKMYSSNFARHFYTGQEIRQFESRWRKPAAVA